MGELRTMARNLDVSHWENGMVELIKEPIGLPNDCRIVGVDPGMHSEYIERVCQSFNLSNIRRSA